MNRREFYKELMREYTFDSAKVRRYAKLGVSSSKQSSLRTSPSRNNRHKWRVPVTAAAAALALVLGLQVILSDLFWGGVPTVPSFNPQDAHGRMENAQQSLSQMSNLSFGTRTLFLSFNDSITFTTMQNTLDSVSDTGNIVIESVYVLENSGKVEIVEAQRQEIGDLGGIVGARVNAPVTLIGDLSRQSEVALVEVSTEQLNENNFVPLAATGFTGFTPLESEPFFSETSVGDEMPTYPPEIVSVETFVNLNIAGVVRAEFIDDYRFTVVTAESIALYQIYNDDDENESLKVRVVASHDLDGELPFSYFDEVNCRKIIRVRNDESNTVYFIDLRGGFELEQVASVSSESRLSVLALTDEVLYYATRSRAVYAYDIATGVNTKLMEFENTVSFERNSGLTAFVLNVSDDELIRSQVFNPATRTFLDAQSNSGLIFYRNSNNVLTDGESYFDTELSLIDNIGDYSMQFTGRNNMSTLFAVEEITELGIRILVK
ncbi:MAG: hypothetical protein FWD35_03350 [Oscillospiraceae bacterium]|nr:hypothetical protein [Oscillospiraceae bacterium]